MNLTHRRPLMLATVVALGLLITGCSPVSESSPEPAAQGDSTEEAPAPPADAPDAPAGADGDYAFGTDRDQIAEAISIAFKSSGGTAAWDGDTLVLTIDGDADAERAGFQQCSVLSHLINDGDATAIKFPNGTVDCDVVLDIG